MSQSIKTLRIKKAKYYLGYAFLFTVCLIAFAVAFYFLMTFMPHNGKANDIMTLPQWQYSRDIGFMCLLTVAASGFLGLFAYWFYQDQKLFEQYRREIIREIVKEEQKK
jgi:hypothetical protein